MCVGSVENFKRPFSDQHGVRPQCRDGGLVGMLNYAASRDERKEYCERFREPEKRARGDERFKYNPRRSRPNLFEN